MQPFRDALEPDFPAGRAKKSSATQRAAGPGRADRPFLVGASLSARAGGVRGRLGRQQRQLGRGDVQAVVGEVELAAGAPAQTHLVSVGGGTVGEAVHLAKAAEERFVRPATPQQGVKRSVRPWSAFASA